jgi:hypothetical protein
MRESKNVIPESARYALGGGVYLLFVGTLIAILGQTAQQRVFGVVVLLVAISVTLAIIAFVGFLYQTCWCSATSSLRSDDDDVVHRVDPKTDSLKLAAESMRRNEMFCVESYSLRRCSAEDVIHAKALRLQAEIALIRYEKRLKSWSEVCAESHSSPP